jgi:serine/threonine protein kinase SCH9
MDQVNQTSRAVVGDDETSENLGFETPRSGVATPQPDLHDRRLPSIMTSFNQVGTSSLSRNVSQPAASSPSLSSLGLRPTSGSAAIEDARIASNGARTSGEGPLFKGRVRRDSIKQKLVKNHMFRPSSESGPSSLLRQAVSDIFSLRTSSPTSVVTTSHATASHISNPEALGRMTGPSTPPLSRAASEMARMPQGWLGSLGQMLTRPFKSGPSTPTRALSQAQPSQADEKNGAGPPEIISRSQTPRPTGSVPSGAQAPAARGKLTIKIIEGRGLRKCRDPYVVVVFQRSELISSGPRAEDGEDEGNALPVHPMMGGVPIQRQGSDSGRPPMAIPMRSRQSSNTSVTDYAAFRSRASRKPHTDPKWGAEAVL